MRTALAVGHPDPEPVPYAWLRPLVERIPWLREIRDDTVPLTMIEIDERKATP